MLHESFRHLVIGACALASAASAGGTVVNGPTFVERVFIDHHNLRRVHVQPDGTFDYDDIKSQVRRIEANLEEAAALGATGYVLFSRIFEHLVDYDLPEERLRAFPEDHPHRAIREILAGALDEVLRKADAVGIPVIMHTNQFTFPPEVYDAYGERMAGTARVCPGKPFTWLLFRRQFEELFGRFPTLAGLQLTTSETQVPITACRCEACRSMDEVARYTRMAEEAYAVCRKYGKRLEFRTWGNLASPDSLSGYLRMADALPDGVIISTKNTVGDFHILSPPTHLLGVGAREQIIEFDAWREYTGWNQLPCYMGDIFAERLRLCAEKGIRRVAVRINWNPGTRPIFDIPWGNAANVHVFMTLAEDPSRDPDELLRGYIADVFPEGARDAAFRFYKLSTKAQITWLTFRGANCNDHSRVFRTFSSPDYLSRCRRLLDDLFREGYTFPVEDLARRRRDIDDAAEEISHVIDEMAPYVPEWADDMRRNLANQVYCAQAITDCLEVLSHMLAVERGGTPGDLSALEKRIDERDRKWKAHDAENYALMCGANCADMLAELRRRIASRM